MKVTLFQLRDFVNAKLVSNNQFESYHKATLGIHIAYREAGYPLEQTIKLTSTKEKVIVWVYNFNLVKMIIESMEAVIAASVTAKEIQNQIIEAVQKNTVRSLTHLSNIKVSRARLLGNIGVLIRTGKIQKLKSGLYCVTGTDVIKFTGISKSGKSGFTNISDMMNMIDYVHALAETSTKEMLKIARECIYSLYGTKDYNWDLEMKSNTINRQLSALSALSVSGV